MDGYLRLRSSVLRPLNKSLASQLEAQQHLLAHYRRVDESKATVDTKPPQSLLHSNVWRDKQNRQEGISSRQRSQSSTPTTTGSSAKKPAESYQRRHHLLSSSRKSTTAKSAAVHEECSVAHKITWYLEAVKSHTFCTVHAPVQHITEKTIPWKRSYSQVRSPTIRKAERNKSQMQRRPTYKNVNQRQIPHHELRNIGAKYPSCDGMLDVPHYRTWLREQAVRAKMRKATSVSRETTSNSDSGRETERSSPAVNFKKIEESYRVDFLNQVTEDILNMGLFSNRAIRKAIEFHVEQHKEVIHKDELEELSQYLMETLNVTKAEDNSFNTHHDSYQSYGR